MFRWGVVKVFLVLVLMRTAENRSRFFKKHPGSADRICTNAILKRFTGFTCSYCIKTDL